MKVLKILLLLVTLVALVAGLTVGQVGLDLQLTLLRPDFYLESLSRQGLFEALPEMTVLYVGHFFEEMPPDIAVKAREAWLEAATPEWFESQFRIVFADVFAFLTGRRTQITATIALGELRDGFLKSFAAKVDPDAAKMMASAMAQVPAAVTLADQGVVPPSVPPKVALGIRLARTVPLAAAGACVLLFGLGVLLAGGLRGGARWAGAAALVSGSLTVAALWLVQSVLLPAALTGIELGQVPDFLQTMDPKAMAAGLAGEVFGVGRAVGFGCLALGAALVVLAAVVPGLGARRAAAGGQTTSS